jgi:hypothetical protein
MQVTREICEDAIPFAIAARLDPDLGRDHRNDADGLHLRCKPTWIEAIGQPRKVVVHAVEADAEQVLNLLRVTPSDPAGRLVCTRDRRQARDGYDVAVWIDGAGLSQLAQRGTCHRPSMWRASAAKANASSRAPVTGSFRPPETPRSDVILQRSALGGCPPRMAALEDGRHVGAPLTIRNE